MASGFPPATAWLCLMRRSPSMSSPMNIIFRPLYPKGSFIASAFYNFHIFASINAIEACQQKVA